VGLDRDPTPPAHRKGHSSPHFVYCGQTIAHLSHCWALVLHPSVFWQPNGTQSRHHGSEYQYAKFRPRLTTCLPDICCRTSLISLKAWSTDVTDKKSKRCLRAATTSPSLIQSTHRQRLNVCVRSATGCASTFFLLAASTYVGCSVWVSRCSHCRYLFVAVTHQWLYDTWLASTGRIFLGSCFEWLSLAVQFVYLLVQKGRFLNTYISQGSVARGVMELRSIAMSVAVCLSVCLFARMS